MNLILASPPIESGQPWSAWLTSGRHSTQSDFRPEGARRLAGAPNEWPVGQAVVLVIPAGKISWHTVTLPKVPRHRWPQALTGLLEDHLLGEPEQWHFALAPGAEAGRSTLAAVCDKTWLTQTLQLLHASGHEIQSLVPEFEPGSKALHLIGQPEQAQLIEVDESGVLVLPLSQPLREGLQSWAQVLTDANAEPLWAEPALAEVAQQGLHRSAQLRSTAQRLWQAAQSDWNLAQFDLAATIGGHRIQRWYRVWSQVWQSAQWRPLRWGLLALIGVQLLGLMTWSWRESSLQKARQEEIQTILRSSFPNVKLIIDPLAQMRREVQALALASGSPQAGDLGVMLSALAEAGAPPIKRLDYSAGHLRLGDWPLPEAQVAPLQSTLALQGYRLEGQGREWQVKVRSQ